MGKIDKAKKLVAVSHVLALPSLAIFSTIPGYAAWILFTKHVRRVLLMFLIITSLYFTVPAMPALAATGYFIDSGQDIGSDDTDDKGVALGDFDGDGDLDAFVVSYWRPNRVWLNTGSGTFVDSGQELGGNSTSTEVAIGDLNGDGHLDAFVTQHNGNQVWLNSGGAAFTVTSQGWWDAGNNLAVALWDLDGDGARDAYVARFGGEPDRVLKNNGSGIFIQSQTLGDAWSRDVALGDVDGDGDYDAFVSASSDKSKLYLNNGSGTFTASSQSLGTGGQVALGDLDGDGDLDALHAGSVWFNNGSGTFTDSGQSMGSSAVVALGDLDNDGDIDAFVSGKVWFNNGSGTFTDSGQSFVVGEDIALGDIDGDGDLDAFVARSYGYNRALINTIWPAPAITSFTPTAANTGTSVTITGSDFTSPTAVKFGGTAASSFTVDSSTQITAVVGGGSSGKVTVTTYGGICSSIGDFTFDNTPPTDPTSVQSTSHTVSTWSSNNTIDVTWTDSTDAGTGLDGYSILWDTSAATIPDAVKDIEEGVQATTSLALADGNSHYFHIRSVDNVGNWQSTFHLGPFFVDATSPTGPTNIQSTSHTASTWSSDNTIDVTWTDATDPAPASGLDGYSILWDANAATIPDAVKDIEEGVQATTSLALADGNSHYFHIRSVDNVGNWQSTFHLGPFFVDATSPTGPTNIQSTSHTASTWSSDNTIDVTWTDATDPAPASGLDGYSILWDANAATIPDAVKDIEEGVQAATSPPLSNGSHYFHIRSVDNVGNWQSTIHLGPFFINITPPEPPAQEKPAPSARPAPLTAGDTYVNSDVDTTGMFTQTVTASSADGKVRVTVEEGVRGLSAECRRLSWITVRPAYYPPTPPAGAHIIGLGYRFQPSGATFAPPITITYTYDESEIPAGIAEEDLVVAVWDEANGQWVELASIVDPVTNTITTQVSHFSIHAIIVHGIPPIQEDATAIQEDATAIEEGSNWGLVGGITGACIAVVILLVGLRRRKQY